MLFSCTEKLSKLIDFFHHHEPLHRVKLKQKGHYGTKSISLSYCHLSILLAKLLISNPLTTSKPTVTTDLQCMLISRTLLNREWFISTLIDMVKYPFDVAYQPTGLMSSFFSPSLKITFFGQSSIVKKGVFSSIGKRETEKTFFSIFR